MRLEPILATSDLFQPIVTFLDRVGDRPWITLIEMLLIGAVVYAALRFLQGTRGARLGRAVFILLAVSFAVVRLLAKRYELDRINELYPYFVTAIFLVSLVAFQTELRRMLLRLGEAGFFKYWSREAVEIIDPIVTAVERLSKKKVGALIAIERNIEVGGLVESGIALDATVSAELIDTIFWPGTPLHDLGMIIQQGRISAAGCQFPLAESGDVDRALGSRHRAGLGMSQDSDAVVIIVSEETGTISVALQGRLRRALSPASLRDLLVKELAPKSKQRKQPTATEAGKGGRTRGIHLPNQGQD